MKNISFEEAECFTPFFLDYVNQNPRVEPLVNQFFSQEAFRDKNLQFSHREVLVQSLKDQYSENGIEPPPTIELLLDNSTHTVTTGHQLCLFTGPLYFHYKIMSTIKLAACISTNNKKVLPVFWMASEDHDFEEVNHFHVGETTYQWQANQSGAVGEFHLDEMHEFLDSIPEEYEWMKTFYRTSKNLAEATRRIVHHLYGKYGVIILDANRPELKKLFLPTVKEELKSQISFDRVSETNQILKKHDYKIQVNPREINLFYMTKGVRERIIKTETGFAVNNTDLSWSAFEFNNLIEEFPERVSPNVILRPVYQQTILPNLAYIGGPGELIYWLQLKSTHAKLGVHFPVLVPRDHILFLEKPDLRKIKKLELDTSMLFLDVLNLKTSLISSSDSNIDTSKEESAIFKNLDLLQKNVSQLDYSLDGFMEAEKKRFEKEFVRIRKKINKAIERKEKEKLMSLNILISRLRPSNSLQERRTNFLYFYRTNPSFLNHIFESINPFDMSFKIVEDD